MPDETQKVAKPIKIFCKLPHGIRYMLPDGKEVRLVGALGDERSPLQVAGMPGRNSVAGFGVTIVNSEHWEQIVKDHGKSAAHANGLIFAAKDDRSGESEAREKAREKSGFEPYDPNAHPEDKSDDGAAGKQ